MQRELRETRIQFGHPDIHIVDYLPILVKEREIHKLSLENSMSGFGLGELPSIVPAGSRRGNIEIRYGALNMSFEMAPSLSTMMMEFLTRRAFKTVCRVEGLEFKQLKQLNF